MLHRRVHSLMSILEAVREGQEETVSSLTSADPTLLQRSEAGGGDTPLLVAVEHGKAGMVKLLLKEGANIDKWGPKGETALMRAITKGNEELVSLLLGHGAREDLADDAGKTPLIWASIQGHLGLVRLVIEAMLERGSQTDVDLSGKDGKTALHHAAVGGQKEVAAFLLSKGAEADTQDENDCTPLMLACEKGHLEVVEMLVEARKGLGLEETDHIGMTALHHAAYGGHKDVVTFLLSKGAQTNTRDDDGSTPLMGACWKGHLDVVQILLEAMDGQGLEVRDIDGQTALHDAVRGGHKEIVALLLLKGAQASSRDKEDSTPFMWACVEGDLEVVQRLLEATEGQGLEDRDNNGETALHLAAAAGHKEVMAFLLSKGAPASTKDARQETPLMHACAWGKVGVVQLLLKHTRGQGLSERNREGKTALHVASSGWGGPREEVVKVLLLAGADQSITDNEGRTPRQTAEQGRRHRVVEAVEWWDRELERAYVLCRARCLHDVSSRQHAAPAAPVPGYLSGRVAGGRALPRVEVTRETEGKTKRKTKRQRTRDGAGEEEQEEGEAVRGLVLCGLNEELFRELLEGFHG